MERFGKDRVLTRHEVRLETGYYDEKSAAVFALVVFLCDDLLQLRSNLQSGQGEAAARVFTIAGKLPIELQMILCRRCVGSMKSTIVRQTSEHAFKNLALLS